MRIKLLIFLFQTIPLTYALLSGEAAGEAVVYKQISAAPRVTSARSISLTAVPGVRQQMSAGVQLASLRIESERSSDSHFGKGRMTSTRRFPRVTLMGFKSTQENLTVEIFYTFSEKSEDTPKTELIQTGPVQPGRSVIIDLEGVIDVTGTEMDTDYSGFFPSSGGVIVHSKTRHFKASLVAISVKVTDAENNVFYHSQWSSPTRKPGPTQ